MNGASAPSFGPKPRHWIACADDFAIDEAAVDGILELVERGRITATSALVTSPIWRSVARGLGPQLARRPGEASANLDIGLHLNLTQAFAAQASAVWPLGELIARCALGAVPRTLLHAAIEHQLDAFEDAMGRRPDYVDGHQHVHQFAIVREALISTLQRRYESDLPWLRSTRVPRAVHTLKARGIAALGDRRLRELAAASNFGVNAYLVGVYDFRPNARSYWRRLVRWIHDGPEATVLMTHPAVHTRRGGALAAARSMEFDVLSSADFGALLEQERITLTTGTRLFASTPSAAVSAAKAQTGRWPSAPGG